MKTVSTLFLVAATASPIPFLVASTAARADRVLVLTDQQSAALISVIGAGLQAQPQLSPNAVFLLNMINTAPTMTGQQVIKPDEPPKEASPKKDDAP